MSGVVWLWASIWGAWRALGIAWFVAIDIVWVVRFENVCINMQRLGLDWADRSVDSYVAEKPRAYIHESCKL